MVDPGCWLKAHLAAASRESPAQVDILEVQEVPLVKWASGGHRRAPKKHCCAAHPVDLLWGVGIQFFHQVLAQQSTSDGNPCQWRAPGESYSGRIEASRAALSFAVAKNQRWGCQIGLGIAS
jgi:hypothetical protein